MKSIDLKEDKIFVSLTYCPRKDRLEKKFGNLPVKYVRTKLENQHEFKLFEKALNKYAFNLEQPQVEEMELLPLPSTSTTTTTTKRKINVIEDVVIVPAHQKRKRVTLFDSDEDTNDHNKNNIVIANKDDDDDEFVESQWKLL